MTRRDLMKAAAASMPAALSAAATDRDFTPLFDGKTLHGWTVVDGPESAFYVQDRAIVISPSANYPTWLRTDRRYENFDFRCDFFIEGWANSGIYIHAPEHGRPTWVGMKVNLFQKNDPAPLSESIGAIFPVIAPKKVNVKSNAQWNTMRIVSDYPALRVWINDELVQDLDVSATPALEHRLRSGYIGIESLSYPLRFRNLRIKELPAKEQWSVLYGGPEDMTKWSVMQGEPNFMALGDVLRGDGLGYLATKEQFRDFELQCYIRASRWHNGGVIFRGTTTDTMQHYEIQLHDVEGAVYPTGSLYHYQRCLVYPRIEPEVWYPFQLIAKDRHCLVRINGDTVVDYDKLERTTAGPIMLQAHQAGRWIEYKEIKIRTV